LVQGITHIQNLARCNEINVLTAVGPNGHSIRAVASGIEIEIPLAGIIDLKAERLRIENEISKIQKEMAPIQKKLANQEFLSNAPQDVVRLNQSRLSEFQEKLSKLDENLKRL
jgi:valyl-tRNA synthetase